MNYGIGNVKGLDKSKSLFTTTTAPTESGGVITLATTDIVESGFKVGDYLAYVDSDNISALYSISAISSGTATLSLVGNIGGGGGKQLYQHNITFKYSSASHPVCVSIYIETDDDTEFTLTSLSKWLYDKGYNSVSNLYTNSRGLDKVGSNLYNIIGVYGKSDYTKLGVYGTVDVNNSTSDEYDFVSQLVSPFVDVVKPK